jgi:ribulose-5-phosphate 4-epimerase/fuculose-1-phosphate aldolase
MQEGLSISNFYAALLAGQVAVHDFEGITTRPEEGPRLVASMGDHRAMILRNHGLLTLGRTVPEAFLRLWLLQRACEVQIAANGPLLPVDPAILETHRHNAGQMIQQGGIGDAEFAAMVRLIDRADQGWRD